ncbi:MAG: VWA domain-containing protein, partial [Chthoniobacterales bacterium]|nr:VWA domain-containing protein [Chthoniobacterales bacterium]
GKGGSAVNFFGISDMATRVVIVVDASDTMFDRQPGKFAAVKQEAIKLVNGLGINTLFNLIIYEGGSVAMLPEVQPATDANKKKAVAWIESVDGGGDKRGMSYRGTYSKMGIGLYEGGGTRTDTALKQALGMRPSTVFLITDGEMSRMGGGAPAEQDDQKKGERPSSSISEDELNGIIKDLQAKMEQPARIHVVHFLTKAARNEEEKILRAVARRNEGRFKQVKAEDY